MPGLVVEEMEFASPAGSKIAIENGVLYPPAVFVNGTLIAKGKIDADKMVATIREQNGARN
jgi:predicted thioredoxin/glutaredoxin